MSKLYIKIYKILIILIILLSHIQSHYAEIHTTFIDLKTFIMSKLPILLRLSYGINSLSFQTLGGSCVETMS